MDRVDVVVHMLFGLAFLLNAALLVLVVIPVLSFFPILLLVGVEEATADRRSEPRATNLCLSSQSMVLAVLAYGFSRYSKAAAMRTRLASSNC